MLYVQFIEHKGIDYSCMCTFFKNTILQDAVIFSKIDLDYHLHWTWYA